MKNKKKLKESEETKDIKQTEATPVPQDEKHDDAEQDKALFKKLLKDYGVSDQDEPSNEEMDMAKEAHAHAKTMGLEGEEAEKCAGYAMKMAKHVATQKAINESEESEESEEKKESEETKESETKESEEKKECKQTESEETKESEEKKETHKESAIALLGENAKLKEAIAKHEMKEKIEEILRESGVGMKYTKVLKEKFLKECKSLEQIKREIGLFMEGYKHGGGEAFGSSPNIVINPEKQLTGQKKGLTFSDCLK